MVVGRGMKLGTPVLPHTFPDAGPSAGHVVDVVTNLKWGYGVGRREQTGHTNFTPNVWDAIGAHQ